MGRTIVITGGTSGIGLELKKLFEKNGDTVLTFSLDETGENNHYAGSVDHEIKVRQVFNDIHERFGTIDMLINCAGIGMSGITELIPTEQIQKLTAVNYYGTLYCTRSALPYMNSGARIVNISSAAALFPVPFRGIYSSVKSAVLNLSFALRMELAPLGIDVTCFCPGDTRTNFTANRIKEFETSQRYGDRIKTATEKKDAHPERRLSCEYVADKIFKYSNVKKTKPFYIVGGKYKFLYFLTRITPKSMLLNGIARRYNGKMVADEKKVKESRFVNKTEEKKVLDVESNAKVDSYSLGMEQGEETHAQVNNVAEETSSHETHQEQPQNNNLNDILSKIKIMNKPSGEDKE